MDAYVGEIRLVAFNYPMQQWSVCDGSKLLIKNYRHLFSVIGNTYGGFLYPGESLFASQNLGDTASVNGFTFNATSGGYVAHFANAGGNQTHDNMQPYTVMAFMIATTGAFPTRP